MEPIFLKRQLHTLPPGMMQSMEILQMGSQELRDYISSVLQENPLLERDEDRGAPSGPDASAAPYAKPPALSDSDIRAAFQPAGVRAARTRTKDLAQDLQEQLLLKKLSPEIMEGASVLIGSLNRNGMLEEDPAVLAQSAGLSPACMDRALMAVQSLDPAGVGARSLSECLRLQLLRHKPVSALALDIVSDSLPELAGGLYEQIAQTYQVSVEKARRACALIRTLNPRPVADAPSRTAQPAGAPDLIVSAGPDRIEVQANDRLFPALRLSPCYTRLMDERREDRSLQAYLSHQLEGARSILRYLQLRRSTMLACAVCIAELQEDFFRRGPGHLVPMSLTDVAERLGVHPSTVSRAVRNKYIQCSFGVYPMGALFTRSLSSQENGYASVSPDTARVLLKKLIAGEDHTRPLTDRQLSELLSAQGCPLSRRTVAKYRDELGIPSTVGRRHTKASVPKQEGETK